MGLKTSVKLNGPLATSMPMASLHDGCPKRVQSLFIVLFFVAGCNSQLAERIETSESPTSMTGGTIAGPTSVAETLGPEAPFEDTQTAVVEGQEPAPIMTTDDGNPPLPSDSGGPSMAPTEPAPNPPPAQSQETGSASNPETSPPSGRSCLRLGDSCSPAAAPGCAGRVVCVDDIEVCEPEPRMVDEGCNGIDDDCDGRVDEDAFAPTDACFLASNMSGPCSMGVPYCTNGIVLCEISPSGDEICNGRDDDCDNRIDEDIPDGLMCENESMVGRCRPGRTVCQDGTLSCEPQAQTQSELCNGEDDDCDGAIDETLALGACNTGLPGRCADGQRTCVGGEVTCTVAGAITEEACNEVDDDCDGEIDESGVCGRYVENHCRIWLGWKRGEGHPIVSSDWGSCHPRANATPQPTSCASEAELDCCGTALLSGELTAVHFNVLTDMNADTQRHNVGLAWVCDDDSNPALADRIQGRCEVYLGHSRTDDQDEFAEDSDVLSNWGPCPQRQNPSTFQLGQRCIRTDGDGKFHNLRFEETILKDDELGVAFICRNAAHSPLFTKIQREVSIVMGIAKGENNVSGANERWSNDRSCWERCPANWVESGDLDDNDLRDNNGDARHVTTLGDGQFHHLDVNWDFRTGSMFSIGIQALELHPN